MNICYVGLYFFFFFFNDTATTEIYTLSLHDALPIFSNIGRWSKARDNQDNLPGCADRKSTRLNSSHVKISYAVFCLKKKKKLNHGFSIVTKKNVNIKVSPITACF